MSDFTRTQMQNITKVLKVFPTVGFVCSNHTTLASPTLVVIRRSAFNMHQKQAVRAPKSAQQEHNVILLLQPREQQHIYLFLCSIYRSFFNILILFQSVKCMFISGCCKTPGGNPNRTSPLNLSKKTTNLHQQKPLNVFDMTCQEDFSTTQKLQHI